MLLLKFMYLYWSSPYGGVGVTKLNTFWTQKGRNYILFKTLKKPKKVGGKICKNN
jgi:hypothetical protein